MGTKEEVRFTGTVSRVSTMCDGGLRFTFDVSEEQTLQAAELMEYKRWQVAVDVTVCAAAELKSKPKANGKSKLGERRKRKSEWQAGEVAGADRDIDEGGK